MRSPCVAVAPGDAEKARRVLAGAGLLARGLKAARRGSLVLFPVVDPAGALDLLARLGVRAEACEGEFEESQRGPRSPREEGLPGYWMVGGIVVFSPRSGYDEDRLRGYAEALVASGVARSAWVKEGTWGDYRLPRLRHLAGERSTRTVAREYGLNFHVDLARAYYNPKLAFEHRRVALEASDGDEVLDMFTGVGGFAIHLAALRRVRVVAVDLNPWAAALASLNVCANRKRLRGGVAVLRADAAVLPELLDAIFDRIIMNHPTGSLRYAEQACRLVHGRAWLHIYLLAEEPGEAKVLASSAVSAAGCKVLSAKARRVLDHSPREFVYAVDLAVEKG